MKNITSSQNNYIKNLLKLQEKARERKKQRLFLVEGLREISLAVKGNYNITSLLFCEDFISVEDILRTINILYKNKKIGIFNIASGKKIKLSKIILIIKKLTKTRKEIIIKKAKRNLNLISDISAIRKLGFKPSFSIEKIIKNFYNFKYKN